MKTGPIQEQVRESLSLVAQRYPVGIHNSIERRESLLDRDARA
jgi:hypothetical protein